MEKYASCYKAPVGMRRGTAAVLAAFIAALLPGNAAAESPFAPFLKGAGLASFLAGRGGFTDVYRSLNTTPYGYTIVADPTGKAPRKRVERFEVRPGDCGEARGWSDCTRDRERAEIGEARSIQLSAGNTAWYRFWLFVPKSTPNVFPTKVTFAQFHQYRSHPLWMFQNHNGGLYLDDQSGGLSRRYYPLIARADFKGRWHRITIHVRWSRKKGGRLQIWVNRNKRVDISGPTTPSNRRIFFKYGVYRSFLRRYKAARGVGQVPAQIALFAGAERQQRRSLLTP